MKFIKTLRIGAFLGLALTVVPNGAAPKPAMAALTPAEATASACSTDLGFAPEKPGYWAFSVDFGDGSVNGCLLVKGQGTAAVAAHPIFCENVGTVSVVNGNGVFDGNEYLKCIVDLKKYVPDIPKNAVYGDGFEMAAQLTGVGIATHPLGNALFHHSSVCYFAPRESFGVQRITSRLNGVSYGSVLGVAGNFWTRSYAACAPACFVHHSLNGAPIASLGMAGPVQINTTDTAFYIGHSPLPGASDLVGTLGFIVIDPGPKPPGGSGT